MLSRIDSSNWGKGNMNIYTAQTQAENITEITNLLLKQTITTVDVISMFFILTFFFDTEDKMLKLINTLSTVIKRGGLVIGTTMDGQATYNYMKGVKIIDNKFFRIDKKYNDNTDLTIGMPINISFKSKNTSVYHEQEEYLVPFEIFRKYMKNNGFTLESTGMFDCEKHSVSDNIKSRGVKDKSANINPCTTQDTIDFSSLNRWFVFKKN